MFVALYAWLAFSIIIFASMLSVTHHALHIWKTANMCGQFQTCVDLPTYDSNLYYVWIFPHMSGFNHTCENSYQCVGFTTHVCRLPQKTENGALGKRCTFIMPPQSLKP